jgi:antitoxin (DNA-binding transcriptional repressor) of toxin-antitoxin stability system
MKQITIEELHRDTERWVKEAAENGGIFITQEGAPVARLETVAPAQHGKPLPDREEQIRRLPYNPIDSATYISEDRDRA